MKTHLLQLPKRKISVTVDEQTDKILVNVNYEKTGEFGDSKDFKLWLESIFSQFENDKRPIVTNGLVVGKTITLVGDKDSGAIAFVSDSK
jgi:hypothetical protein